MAKLSTSPGGQPNYGSKKKALLEVDHRKRRMKAYTVTELEINTISSLNTGCTFGIGMATLFIGAGLGFLSARESIDMDKAPAEAKVLLGSGMGAVFLLGLAFAVFAAICYFRSGGMIDTIKKESESEVST
jgi:hypothetical protein